MWRVALEGKDSGNEYVYLVRAPESATQSMVELSAYNQHGKLFGGGKVNELARPVPLGVDFLA
jgi:hypothetical protein